MLNLPARFWTDVRFVFRHSGAPLGASLRVEPTPSQGTEFQGTSTPCRLSVLSQSRTFATKHGRPSPSRPTHAATARASPHDRAWEDEVLQDTASSWPQQQQTVRVSSPEGDDIPVRDESLRAASPLRSCAYDRSPRFDWRLRAPSRTPALRNDDNKTSRGDGKAKQPYVKRVVPQHFEIEPGARFHDEVRSYEDRWVFLSLSVATGPHPFFFCRFLPLLALERAEEERELRERLAKWPLKRLCNEGYCITGMSGFWLDTKFGHIAAFNLGPGIALPDNKFE